MLAELLMTWQTRKYRGNLTLRQYHIFRLYHKLVKPAFSFSIRGASDEEMSTINYGINAAIAREWNTPEEDRAWAHLID